ncbi:MAG: outer membrane beta-barrel protein [Rhodothermales bacterium]
MKQVVALVFILLLTEIQVHAQVDRSIVVSGRTVQAADGAALEGVNVVLTPVADTTRHYGAISDNTGFFRVAVAAPGAYRARFSFVGFKTIERNVELSVRGRDLGTVGMEKETVRLDQVVVEATQERVVMKGDTTEYNADAFKVNPDASAEDLVAKMPGIVVEDGAVQAHGEDVKKVLVDGREFFGDDPTAALRNLPSEIIDKIQVFDKLSDQAQFTGFDDGNSEKTINIVTRPGRSNGQFGKVYGGYGSDNRYMGGGNVNVFDGARRISAIGLSNNVNQQNFTTEDLLGVIGNARRRSGFGGGARGRGGGGRAGGGDRPGGGRATDGPGGGVRGLSTNPSNFLVGNQGGVSATTAVGVNYIDQWGGKVRVTGSYFFNMSDNTSDVLLDRQYLLADAGAQFYNETNNTGSDNFNHRFTLRMQYDIDGANSIIFTPRLSTQRHKAESVLDGINTLDDATFLSRTTNDYLSENTGYTSSGNVLFRHRFDKRGRTLSLNLGVGFNDRSGESDQYSSNVFFDEALADQIIDQRTDDRRGGLTLSSNLVYTEPLGRGGQVQVTYRPSFTRSDADRRANALDEAAGTYSLLDPALSNTFDNDVMTQRGGIGYRLRRGKALMSVGLHGQVVHLSGDQTFPTAFTVDQSFRDLLPQAMLQYRFSRSNDLRLFYRTSTRAPSIAQLQDVIDNTNPLQLSTGNPDLKQSFTHTILARYNVTNVRKGQVFIGFVAVSQTRDYIGSESLLAEEDMTLDGGILLAQGSQFTRPVNLDGYWNARSFFTLGFPVKLLKSNLNLNAGYTYARTPGVINGVLNTSAVQNVSGGAVLGSNISERLDFTLSFALNYNLVENTVYPELDANYLFHRSSVRFTWLPWKALVLNTTVNYSSYEGLDDTIDQSALLWNAGVGYKFLKGNGGEVKLVVADLLNQNNSVSRTVNEFYIEDHVTNVLGRYVMLRFTYTLRNFRL